MKAYAVTIGNYSDYRICTISLDKEKAAELAKIYSTAYDEAIVEEYEIDEGPDDVMRGWLVYGNEKNGTVYPSRPCGIYTSERNDVRPTIISATKINGEFVPVTHRITVEADTEDRARKIAADLFREYRVMQYKRRW